MDYSCEILSNDVLKGPYRRIVFAARELAEKAYPGGFVHVRIPAIRDRILRRPFSICDADSRHGTLTLVYKVVGVGTTELAAMVPGESCDIMGPQGHGFSTASADCYPILVAGGYGAASTLFQARTASMKGVFLMGARTADDLILTEDYKRLGFEVRLATNDGSAGTRGFVTELLNSAIASCPANLTPVCYACGPAPMLYALGKLALQKHLRTELSLDHHMCCGVGACFACVIKVRDESNADGWRYSRTCKEGPVYSAEEVYYV